jgi:hypothetical protein
MEKWAECGEMLPFRMDDGEIMPCPACGSTCRIEDDIKEKITFKIEKVIEKGDGCSLLLLQAR